MQYLNRGLQSAAFCFLNTFFSWNYIFSKVSVVSSEVTDSGLTPQSWSTAEHLRLSAPQGSSQMTLISLICCFPTLQSLSVHCAYSLCLQKYFWAPSTDRKNSRCWIQDGFVADPCKYSVSQIFCILCKAPHRACRDLVSFYNLIK